MKLVIPSGIVVLALTFVAGCSKPSTAAVAASHADLFPSGHLKKDLETVISNLQTNGYVSAEVNLVQMERESPNAQQILAIHETMTRLKEEARSAAERGDINASNQFRSLIRTNILLY